MASETVIRLASDLEKDSIANGPGLRMVVWTQGCPHHCPGCHNPQTWDETQGIDVSVDSLLQQVKNTKLQKGITLSGGEPFRQAKALMPFVKECRQMGYDVWAFSGYYYEELLADAQKKALLELVDVLVDGPFEMDKKDFRLYYKGSSNQRIIDVPASIKAHQVVLSEYEQHNIELEKMLAKQS